MAGTYGAAWRTLRRRVLIRDGYVCHWCGGRASVGDHVKALADGGAMLDPANVVAACARCNSRRGGITATEQAAHHRAGIFAHAAAASSVPRRPRPGTPAIETPGAIRAEDA